MAKFLIVDDDEYFRESLKVSLMDAGHHVTEAPNGKVARDILGTAKFDAVISDVQMPFLNGIELLEWIQKNCRTPFIMMTGFSNIIETKTAFEFGAQHFLPKPFKIEDLFAAVKRVLHPAQPEETDNKKLAEAYCKVSIDEFVARNRIDFDVYVQLSQTKYVCIGYAGSEIPSDRITSYKSKGVKHLHIKREDFGKLVAFNLELSHLLAKKKSSIPPEKLSNFLRYTGEVILEKAFVDGVNTESIHEAKNFVGLTMETLLQDPDNFNLLDLLNSHSDVIYAHSLGVALYSTMIAKQMGYGSQQNLFKLSMAGIFHDIGKKEIDREILEKPRPLLSQTERKMIESHPTRSKEILLQVKSVPEDVVQMIYEHHEDCMGEGYPRKINKLQMHPLSKVIQCANIFVEQVLKTQHGNARSPKAAVEYMENVYGERLDKTVVKALRELFNPD